MAGSVAVVAGGLTFGAVFLIAALARQSPARRPAAVDAAVRLGAPSRWPRRHLVVVATAGFGAVLIAGPVGAVVLALIVAMAGPVRRRRSAARARTQIRDAMPDAVELFVVCVHAGRSPPQVIAELARSAPGPVRPAFAAVELQLHRGRSLADALDELPRIAGPPGRELATAVATADRDGLPLAPVLDRLATEARADRRRAGEAAERSLPVRLSFPLVVCTLPSFVLLAIAPAVLGALSMLRGRAP
ncbi:MAG: type II secretion system F family protein [Ilumatobacteraceae bacterium]